MKRKAATGKRRQHGNKRMRNISLGDKFLESESSDVGPGGGRIRARVRLLQGGELSMLAAFVKKHSITQYGWEWQMHMLLLSLSSEPITNPSMYPLA